MPAVALAIARASWGHGERVGGSDRGVGGRGGAQPGLPIPPGARRHRGRGAPGATRATCRPAVLCAGLWAPDSGEGARAAKEVPAGAGRGEAEPGACGAGRGGTREYPRDYAQRAPGGEPVGVQRWTPDAGAGGAGQERGAGCGVRVCLPPPSPRPSASTAWAPAPQAPPPHRPLGQGNCAGMEGLGGLLRCARGDAGTTRVPRLQALGTVERILRHFLLNGGRGGGKLGLLGSTTQAAGLRGSPGKGRGAGALFAPSEPAKRQPGV